MQVKKERDMKLMLDIWAQVQGGYGYKSVWDTDKNLGIIIREMVFKFMRWYEISSEGNVIEMNMERD